MTRAREGLVLGYAERSVGGALQHPSPFLEEARAALQAPWEERAEELFGPDETLHATFTTLRDELLRSIPRTGGRLGELRLDTDLDVAHGAVRYLELVKLAALIDRPEGQSVADALPRINTALLGAATAQQREILQTSSLDEMLLDAERDARARAAAIAAREEPSLEPFLPTRGDGLLLSASDIETYRTCPLKYKFARVFRIPSEPTLNQRFGILVHQVLERYHQSGGRTIDEMLGLLEAGWRRGGFGTSDQERQLHAKADGALRRYHERFREEDAEPLWFEKAFSFRMGAHTLRGRVDRVDRLPDGDYELIDYKTGRPRSAAQLREDVQLSLYAVGAREAWGLPSSRQSYLYVLDDAKVPLPVEEVDRDWITETVFEVADGILAQGFEPTPSYAACSICDYRIACPAAERDERPAAPGGARGQPLVRRARGAARLLADASRPGSASPSSAPTAAASRPPCARWPGLLEPERGRRARRGRRPASRARGRARPRADGARARQPAALRRPDRARAPRARDAWPTRSAGSELRRAHRRAPGVGSASRTAATSARPSSRAACARRPSWPARSIRPAALLLLDEPVVGLDPPSQALLHELLLERKAAGCAILLTTHQLGFAEGLADRGMLLSEGEVDRRRQLRDVAADAAAAGWETG